MRVAGIPLGVGQNLINPINPNTKLLLRFDGADGSTTFTDSSSSNHAMSIGLGTPIISTARTPPWGSSSLEITYAVNEYIQTELSSDFDLTGNQPFTIEYWAYLTSYNTLTSSLVIGTDQNAVSPIRFYGDGTLAIGNATLSSWQTVGLSSGVLPTSSAWNNFCVVGNGTTIKAFVNGQNTGSTTTHPNWTSANRRVFVGIGGGQSASGNYKGVRFTQEALYSSNYTPPTNY